MNPETDRNVNVFMDHTMLTLTAIIMQLILIGAFISYMAFKYVGLIFYIVLIFISLLYIIIGDDYVYDEIKIKGDE